MRESLLLVALICLLPLAASAQRNETAPLSLETGIGFTSGPTTFLLATELPIRVARYVDLGPMLQLGFGDHRLIVAPTVNARYSFPLSRFVTNESPVWDRLRPMVHGGPGLAYMRNTHRRGDDDELGFLFNVGAGIQYDLTDRVSAGTRMTFNVLPTGVLDDHFFFSWQVAQLRFEF